MTAPRRTARDDELLDGLLREVNRCRARVRAARDHHPTTVTRRDRADRCAQLADAMDAYADAAAASGVPLPYRYRDELRLYRAMAADGPPQRP